MCGIAGFSLAHGAAADTARLAVMAQALAHRGPDGEGFWTHRSTGLAHRRLSIIDLSGGRQPLALPQAPLALVANGEIYNYKALQALLAQDGVATMTQSDCEPPLHRYLAHGPAALEELEGMYALALADGRDGTLHLATDPFGIKPLYYTETPAGFAFASEPRALAHGGWVAPRLNPAVLGALLNRHCTPGADTLWEGVFRMVPGERITVQNGKIIHRQRRLPPLTAPRAGGGDDPDAFSARLNAAVARHLQADVPYGLLLSGGLDSTALAVAMRDLGAPLTAYTAVVDAPGGPNEADTARAVAQALGARHVTVPYGGADFWPGLVDLAWTMDDLTTDYAALPLLKLTARAREDVKILLSGEGGDELLAGYSSYRRKQGLLAAWRARRSGDVTPFRHLFNHPRALAVPPPPPLPWDTAGWTPLQTRQARDVAGWLPADLLLKLDRTTMVHGIEGRVPYLDDHFAAWAFSLPDAAKVRPPYGKHLVRRHLEAKAAALPPLRELAWARKQGFSVAVGGFMAEHPQRIRRVWAASPLLGGLLAPHAADHLLARLEHSKCANLCFSLTLLALWEALHIHGADRAALARMLA